MTRKVEFFDTSLRDGEQTPGVNFSIKEKVAIAKQLEKYFSNCLAIATFSLIEKFTPGVCSPSRRLVSKNSTLRVIDNSFSKIQRPF